jgi:hypothetical protein
MHLFFEGQQWKKRIPLLPKVWQVQEEYSQAVLPVKILVGML